MDGGQSDGLRPVTKVLGIILIVVGIVGLAYGGFTWTQKETVIDAGPIQITADDKERLPIPPLAGGLMLVAGVVLMLRKGN